MKPTLAYQDAYSIHSPNKLFIGGKWVTPTAGGFITLTSPDTEEDFAQVAEATEPDVDSAVSAARDAFDSGPWPRMPLDARVDLLERYLERLKARSGELHKLPQLQIGALSGMASFITASGMQAFENAIKLSRTFRFEARRASPAAGAAFVIHEPVGVVAAIAPWNAPFMTMAAKLAPALLVGCTVVMKPSPETPLEAYILAECAEEVGFPPGVLNLVTADRQASDHLVCNPGVDKVSFTGSTAVGRRIASVCGERIARYSLELGGKSAVLVHDDMAIDEAAKILAATIAMHSGQICQMLSRAIVPRRRHDDLAAAIAREMSGIRVGHSDDPAAMMGPLAMKRQLDRVERYVKIGIDQGADLRFGGQRPAHLGRGFFHEPTLFSNVASDMTIAQEEIFGPVLALMPCEDIEDGIRIANDSIFGLNGSVLTHNPSEAYRIGRRMRTGNIAQNGLHADFALPFGGFKQSGVGREGDVQGLMSFLETKTILIGDQAFVPNVAP